MTQTNPDQQQTSANASTGSSSDSNEDIPEGIYDAKALGETEPHVQFGVSDSGNEQLAIEMHLVDINRDVFVILNFSDKAAPYSLDRLRALGWKGGDGLAGITENVVKVRAKWDHYLDRQGQEKSSMKFEILTGSRFSFQKPMDDSQKRGFFARLNSIAQQAAPTASTKAPQQKGGYPADWDKPMSSAKPPKVQL